MNREIVVVGAVIIRDGLVFCVQRGPDGSLPGMWEFPGGKVEPGETPAGALAREIQEELGCGISIGAEVTTTSYDYDFATVRLTTFYCRLVAGQPELTEHVAQQWLRPDALGSLAWAPADLPAVAHIQSDLAPWTN